MGEEDAILLCGCQVIWRVLRLIKDRHVRRVASSES